MEAIGAAVSIITLLQVAGKLTVLGCDYIRVAKNASNEIKDLMREVASFNKVLVDLRKVIDELGFDCTVLQNISGEVGECQHELASLISRLERHRDKKRHIRSLKWPLQATETKEIVARLERYKTAFLLAINIANLSLAKARETQVQTMETNISSVHLTVGDIHADARAASVARSIREDREEIALAKKKRKDVLDWLYPDSVDEKHNEISSRRQKDTGNWLLESKQFRELETGVPEILWGYGIPGAGKTFLSSRVIDHLQAEAETMNYGVAKFYFDYKQQNEQTPVRVISSLAKDLAMQQRNLPDELEKLHDKLEHRGKKPSFDELLNVLISLFSRFERVFLVFDALDECNEKGHRKKLLSLLHTMRAGGAHIFATSRHYPEDIQRPFSGVARIELTATGGDIKKYVLGKIEESSRLTSLVEQAGPVSDLKGKIVLELIECANGMFLLVHFHIVYLCAQTTVKQLLVALDLLKSSITAGEEHPLDPTYDRVMAAIRQQPKPCLELAMNVFSWLVTSCRPLTVGEVRIAVSVQFEQCTLDESDKPDKATLLEVCAGLVIIDEASNTIHLSHLTVHEYLIRTASMGSKLVHSKLAAVCTSYLSLGIFSRGGCLSRASLDARLTAYPFFEYIARHLPTHLKSADENASHSITLQLYRRTWAVSAWTQASLYLRYSRNLVDHYFAASFRNVPPVLHVASYIGNQFVIRQLLTAGEDISTKCSEGRSVLHWAVVSGDMAVIRLLVDHGASVLNHDNSGRSTLLDAASSGNPELVQYVLNGGACPHTAASDGTTPIIVAALNGHDATVRLLLDNGVDISIANDLGYTALHCAAYNGHEAVVRLLLDNGADSSVRDKFGNTALLRAAADGQEGVIRILLRQGASPSVQNLEGTTPLHYAMCGGYIETARTLLQEPGVSPSTVNNKGQTPLHLAAYYGHRDLVKHLLECGADPSVATEWGNTALTYARRRRHHGVVKELSEWTYVAVEPCGR